MRIAYNLLVVIDVDEESSPSSEVNELSAQLRLAAQHVTANGAPEAGDAERLSRRQPGAPIGRNTVVYLSAVEL